jgi:hypothetical protein
VLPVSTGSTLAGEKMRFRPYINDTGAWQAQAGTTKSFAALWHKHALGCFPRVRGHTCTSQPLVSSTFSSTTLAAPTTWKMRRGLSLDPCASTTHRPLGPAPACVPRFAVNMCELS